VRSNTKTKILLVAFMLLSLGWAQPGWSVNMDADLRKFTNELEQKFESVRTGPYGAFVYRNISTIAIIYSLVALSFLLRSEYRDRGWHNLLIGCVAPLVFVACFVVGYAIAQTFREITQAHGGLLLHKGEFGWWFITLFTGIMGPLLMIALILALWIGIPLYLLFLLFTFPSMLFVILRFLVRLPILTYHYLHYLSVSHPAETAYRKGVANDLPMEELASVVADAMYMYDHGDLDALPPAWQSRNKKKRAEAFKDLVDAEGPLMEAIMRNLEMKDKLREHRRTTNV
jgi:hypothetical protein